MIRQLSVFVENRPGSLMEVTSALVEANINIRAVASFDTPDFAILRLIVDKPTEAKGYLSEKGFVVRVNEVTGAQLEDEKGNLNQMLAVLTENRQNINYIYSFVFRKGKSPVMVFHTDDPDTTSVVLRQAGIKIVEEEDLGE